MRFSIIIPAHNSSAYIRRALDSIKQQTFTDYELIVVCDNCTDNTADIAREYGAIVEEVQFGRDGLTRNKGIDIAQGEYLLFMDDDDWWLHEFVLTQLDAKLRSVPNADVLCFSFIFKHWKYAAPRGNNGSYWIAVWNKCWRRSCIGNTRFSDKEKVSDVDFHSRMMEKGLTIVDWDMPMYYYNYFRPGSQTQVAEKQIPDYFKFG